MEAGPASFKTQGRAEVQHQFDWAGLATVVLSIGTATAAVIGTIRKGNAQLARIEDSIVKLVTRVEHHEKWIASIQESLAKISVKPRARKRRP